MFVLVSSRYERASMIVTSNKPFSRWGEIFGDDIVAAAMIDRLVHHAEIVDHRGNAGLNYRSVLAFKVSRGAAELYRCPAHRRGRRRPAGGATGAAGV